ncbi:Cellulose biosynthesis protein BcsF, partial [Dysosmobacter welbionis]
RPVFSHCGHSYSLRHGGPVLPPAHGISLHPYRRVRGVHLSGHDRRNVQGGGPLGQLGPDIPGCIQR